MVKFNITSFQRRLFNKYLKSRVKKNVKNQLKILFKKYQKKNKIKRIYFNKLYRKYNNKIWKQKINWKFRWKIKNHKSKEFKYNTKLLKKTKLYLKNKVIKNYLKMNDTNSLYYKNKSIRQFLDTFNKIKRRSLSFRRQKRKKLKWYKIKYKQNFINYFNLPLTSSKYNKLKFYKKDKQKLIYVNFEDKNKLKKYLKDKAKNKKVAEFFNKNKMNNRKWKSYWTYLKIFWKKRNWSRKNRIIKNNIKQKFLNYKAKNIRKYLLKQLLQKFIKKQNAQKSFFINKYGIKKNNKAYFRKEKDKQKNIDRKSKNKFYYNNNKRIFFRKPYNYRIFDSIKVNIKKNYLLSKKILKFIAKNNMLSYDKYKIEQLKLLSEGGKLTKLKLYNKIKLQNLLKVKQINVGFLRNKNNVLNLLRINNSIITQKPKLPHFILIKKIKNITLTKFRSNGLLNTKYIKYKLKKLNFISKKQLVKKNKHLYNLQVKDTNTNLFNSLALLKQKKQILYLHNLMNTPKFINNEEKNTINKVNLLKKIKLLKRLDKKQLLNYIKNKKSIKQKINKNIQSLNKVSAYEKPQLIKKIEKLNKQKIKIKHLIAFYKNRLKKKLKWLFRVAKRSSKLRKYDNLLKNKQFKEFIKNKQNISLIPNSSNLNNKLKLYSYNLSKHIDDNNKWMNYYIRKSFKWKFFKKRWHYRYSKWKRLSYFKKLMQRAKDSYRKLQKNFIFIKLFRANFNNFMGISEVEMLNKWIKLRRGDNHNDNTNIVTRFNQMLQLKLDGLAIFLGLAPSRFLAQELIKCGGLRINGIIVTNVNHFISLNNILQIDLQIKEDLKLFYSFNHWIKVKARLKYVEFLQVMWPMMMFMLIRWPHNYELYEDSVLTSRWIRFFIRYFPIRISKYKKPKVKWYKY